MPSETLTAFAAAVVVPVVAPPTRDAAVLVDGDRIVAVVRRTEVPPDAAITDFGDVVLTPGLVNAHAHLEYGPAFADLVAGDRPFADWIAELTRRRQALTPDDWYAEARASAAAALRTGTTCVADIVTDGAGMRAAADAGLAGISYAEAVGVGSAHDWRDRERPRVLRNLEQAPPGRALGLSPHTLYTLADVVFKAVVDLARERGLRLHPHLAETLDEEEYVMAGTGRFAFLAERFGFTGAGVSPARHLDALGGLGADVHVAHGVHCGAADRALLRERGTTVALCPRSNATLRAGTAPVAAYLTEGNPLAIGTDSLSSTPDLDLLAELGAARELARDQGYGYADIEQRLFEAATIGGARAMGLGDVGRLAPGARADLAAFAVPTAGDPYDPYTALIDAGAGTCVATVLGGRPVVRRERVAT